MSLRKICRPNFNTIGGENASGYKWLRTGNSSHKTNHKNLLFELKRKNRRLSRMTITLHSPRVIQMMMINLMHKENQQKPCWWWMSNNCRRKIQQQNEMEMDSGKCSKRGKYDGKWNKHVIWELVKISWERLDQTLLQPENLTTAQYMFHADSLSICKRVNETSYHRCRVVVIFSLQVSLFMYTAAMQ